MASLYLVRHGQASFMAENYDQLSTLGEEQARVLGDYLTHKNFQFDASFSGLLNRHKGTLAGVQERYAAKGLAFPESIFYEELNEHQGAEIHKKHLPTFLQEPENQVLAELFEAHGAKHPEVRKGLLRLFFRGTKLWAKGEIHTEGYESFVDFKQRITKAYQFLLEDMENYENAIAFTSGGTIAMLIGLMLDLNDEKVIELNWQTRNAGITEFSYSKGAFFLRSFNETPHLEEERLVSYV